jgi:hypothetical protein
MVIYSKRIIDISLNYGNLQVTKHNLIINDKNIILPYKYTVRTEKNADISIYNELLRSKIIHNLINIFKREIYQQFKGKIKNLNKIFKYNKLDELVQKWAWFQYNNKTIQDDVIPYVSNNIYNFKDFITDFNNILNINISENQFTKIKNKIASYLSNSFKLYTQIKDNNNINLVITKSNETITYTIKYDESINYAFNFNNVKNSKNIQLTGNTTEFTLNIHTNLYTHLYNRFTETTVIDNNVNPDKYIYCLVFRYSYIDSGNQQLAINRKIKDMFKLCGVDFELFGSGINVVSKYYCSLFYDIEKYFGSQGNFFDIELKEGIYWCNPPYDEIIMENAAKKIITTINNNKNIAFLVTIPIWDNYTKKQEITKIMKNINKNTDNSKHTDYQIYYLLKPFIKNELLIPKKKIPYFNYRLNTAIYAVDTYMLFIYKDIDTSYTHPIDNIFNNIEQLGNNDFFIT